MRKLIVENKKVNITTDEIPSVKPLYILVKTLYSAISPGTEISMIQKSTNKKYTIGYSAVGVVVDRGSGIKDVEIGDAVACYGAPYVHHAEYLLVPQTLYAKVPPNINLTKASLGGIGAIAIHALRIANLQFGEKVIIVGLGLLGQMIAKIANAAAYHVTVCDIDQQRLSMIEDEKIQLFQSSSDVTQYLQDQTVHHGYDAVFLCLSGKDRTINKRSLEWLRDRGKVVIVGDIEPNFPRELLFRKEAKILISRAGGPGRYDEVYEGKGVDYPYGYVRWTEGRNLAEFIRLVSQNVINVETFIKNIVKFTEVNEAYTNLMHCNKPLTYIIDYS